MAAEEKFLKRMQLVFVFTGFYVAGTALEFVCCTIAHLLLGGGATGRGELLLLALMLMLGGISTFIILIAYVLAAIFFLIMLYHATEQARGFKMPYTYGSPGMAAGCWFIPFANLVLPYVTMRDLLRSAADSTEQKRRDLIVGFWWAGYLVLDVYGSIFFVMNRFSDHKPDIGTATLQLSANGALQLVTGCLFWWMLSIWKDMHVKALKIESTPIVQV